MLFYIKVRIDTDKLLELGGKLQSGELDTSSIKWTYCLKDDPTVGISIWEAENKESFELKFAPHKGYYKELLDISTVITPEEAMMLIMENKRATLVE